MGRSSGAAAMLSRRCDDQLDNELPGCIVAPHNTYPDKLFLTRTIRSLLCDDGLLRCCTLPWEYPGRVGLGCKTSCRGKPRHEYMPTNFFYDRHAHIHADSVKMLTNDVSTRSARPHTAHGPIGDDKCKGPSFGGNDRVEVTPAVAGARGMMR